MVSFETWSQSRKAICICVLNEVVIVLGWSFIEVLLYLFVSPAWSPHLNACINCTKFNLKKLTEYWWNIQVRWTWACLKHWSHIHDINKCTCVYLQMATLILYSMTVVPWKITLAYARVPVYQTAIVSACMCVFIHILADTWIIYPSLVQQVMQPALRTSKK